MIIMDRFAKENKQWNIAHEKTKQRKKKKKLKRKMEKLWILREK